MLRWVVVQLNVMVRQTVIIFRHDHSPNDKQIAFLKYGGGTFFVLVQMFQIQFLILRPMDTAVLEYRRQGEKESQKEGTKDSKNENMWDLVLKKNELLG